MRILARLALAVSALALPASGPAAQVSPSAAAPQPAAPSAHQHGAPARGTVAPGDTVRGTVTVAGRTLDVHGIIEGDAIALGGDVVVHHGARVQGDATAIGGRVVLRGGTVRGATRQIGLLTDDRSRPVRQATTWEAIKVVLGWLAILAAIGIGVLLFAEGSLTSVTETLERHLARSFWYGLLAQLALLPSLLILVTALALTVVGLLLVPFAVVAYAIVVAGLLTLGFLAVARFTGSAFRRGAGRTTRGQHLSALLRGLALYLSVFFVAAALTSQPLAAAIVGSVAIGISWVAATVGLGAAIGSRVDARRKGPRHKTPPMDPMVWQTPTPITGVAAARRPKKAEVG
ncbi:MAG TPA: polymer-forming cytoskeletal protein [Gemmatimonadaceae bacterium]|nr:polymer-forming cytoskeletal protein [Gemmatimonadaceae bacterium]